MQTKSAKKAPAKKTTASKAPKCAARKCAAKKPCAKSVSFTIHAEQGKAVYLAGEFNGWDPTATKMDYVAESGYYAAVVKLAPGDYQYKFVIDGAWCADPLNAQAIANDQGTFNSIITVK